MPDCQPSPNPAALLQRPGVEILPRGVLGEGLETYRVFADITEVVASYKQGYYLPIFLKIYILK